MQKNSSKCTLELSNNNFPSPINSGNKEDIIVNNLSNNNKEDVDFDHFVNVFIFIFLLIYL